MAKEDHFVHYEKVPMHDRHGFVVPRDVIAALGGGDPEVGNLVLLDTFGVHPMSAPLGAIHPDAVRELGRGNPAAGRKVLSRFIQKVRKRHTLTEGKSTKPEAHYRPGTDAEHCGICTMFRAPDRCTAVKGEIEPRALCDYFSR